MGNIPAKKDPRDIHLGGFTLTATGIEGNLSKPPSHAQFRASLAYVGRCAGATNWWVGDLARFADAWGDEYVQMLDELDLEFATLEQYRRVAEGVEFHTRVRNLSWAHHRIVYALTPAEQRTWLKKAQPKEGEITPRLSVAELRKAIADQQARKALADTPLPPGKYHLIYADPPWRYDFSKSDNRKIENQYSTMDLDLICEMKIGEKIAGEHCVLFLWATSPKLAEALTVMDSWGFEYKTCMVWRKDKIGMGYYARQQHEILLIGTTGSPPQPRPETRPPSVLDGERSGHSKKPDVFYEHIERMYPKARKIELFCRKPREGWDAWGNEVTPIISPNP